MPSRPFRARAATALAVTAALSCATPHLAPPTPREHTVEPPWERERAELVRAINATRAAADVPALAYDTLLQRIGDLHCLDLLNDGVAGHFALDGVPPYLRYLLAGGYGYHRENAGSRSSSADISPQAVGTILQEGLSHMLAEVPPHDGHRRTLLDPAETHVGVGVALRDGEVRVAQEFAVELATAWEPPPPSTMPGSVVAVEGRLALPWRLAAVGLLWEPLPHRLTREEAAAISSYSYPPRREWIVANQPALPGVPPPDHPGLTVRHGNGFRFAWQTRSEPGVEIVVVWARRSMDEHALTPAGAACTVVTDDGRLPPSLARWAAMRDADHPVPGCR